MAYPFTVAPHLAYFQVPFSDFTKSRPEFTDFAVGGYIFSQAPSKESTTPPRILLIQRALCDSLPGCWEGPGGASEPAEDKTLLDGVAREVLEETGLHVSRIVELVAVDGWSHKKRSNGEIIRIAKYSFLVDVYESLCEDSSGGSVAVPCEEIPVRLDPNEHQAFEWAVEEDVQASLELRGKYELPPNGHQGINVIRAFELFKNLRKSQ